MYILEQIEFKIDAGCVYRNYLSLKNLPLIFLSNGNRSKP